MKRLIIALLVCTLGGRFVFAQEEAPKEPAGKMTRPTEITSFMNLLIGNWSVEGTIGDTAVKGRSRMELSPDGHCLLGTVSIDVSGELFHVNMVSGWDSSTGWLTEQGIGSDGMVYTLPWQKVSETVSEGSMEGTVDGTKVTAKNRIEKKPSGEVVFTSTQRTAGSEAQPDLKLVFRPNTRTAPRRSPTVIKMDIEKK